MKILALDIGTASVKAILVETKFHRFNITLHDVVSVRDALEPFGPEQCVLSPGQVSALQELASRHAGSVDRIVANLPFSLYSSRFLSFPFRDKRKVQNAVKFAIEDEIPFDLDECILASHPYPADDKQSHVLTAFAPLETLEPFVNTLDNIGLPTGVLVTDEAALASLFLSQKTPSPGRGMAVLNLGHRKSGIFLFRDQLPVSHRITMNGGYHLTKAISEHERIGMNEAEVAKRDHREELPDYVKEALEPLLHDLQQGLMAYSSRYGENVSTVYLTGGGALLHGLREYLEEKWNCRVENLIPTHLHPQLAMRPQQSTEMLLAVAAGAGITQVSGPGRCTLNLRSGKLRIAGESYLPKLEQLAFPMKLGAAVYVAALISLIGQNFLLDKEISNRELMLDAALKNVLGATSSSFLASLKANPSRLKRTIDEKVEESGARVKDTTKEKTGIAALDLLKDLSQKIPRSTPVEIRKMEVSDKVASIHLESPTENDANIVIRLLKEVPTFQSAASTPITATDSGRKAFQISLQWKGGTK